MQAQFGDMLKNVKNSAKNKVKQRVDNKVDNAMDNALDEAEGKGKSKTATPADETSTKSDAGGSAVKSSTIVSNSKFDFVPGDKVIYSEDFSQDAIGELPVNWNANGKGEVVTIDGQQGKWLRMFPGITYLSGSKAKFGDNYTIEFDVIIEGTPPSGTRYLPGFNFGMFSSGAKDGADNVFLKEYYKYNFAKFRIQPNIDKDSRMDLESRENNQLVFNSETTYVPTYSRTLAKVTHYAIQVQKQRCRFWINQEKIFDVPRAISLNQPLNQFFLEVSAYHFFNESNFGAYVSNIKIAAGIPDTRHKFLEEGKFSTTGILFDFQSADIKPESFGVIKEMATVLKENGDVRVKVVGHTSNDGDDAANMELSKKRAEAVKAALVKEFSIDASRIEAAGKGETQPVADNKTKEGKMQNRRVEFIKL
jgi:outer membrane protein OmpA-like peptidoglycan-associated protein